MLFLSPKRSNYRYSIFRILGNETPPRDAPDARLKTLEFILDNEPDFPNTLKCWIINRVHDRERREHLARILAARGMYYVIVPLFRVKYQEAKNRAEKVTELIGINRARNLAITHGKLVSRFTFLLDGDCMFTQRLWEQVTASIETDQKVNQSRKYYSIPSSRATFEHVLQSDEPMLLAEPMTVHRFDADKLFNEQIPFGQGDKLKYLFELGHNQEPGKHHILVHNRLCKSVGLVHHVGASDYAIELDQKRRTQLREQSLDKLIWQVDNPDQAFPRYAARRHNKPNTYWQKIQGWFDFRGQYSHFAWEQPDGCRFVEVGSWLGASICYLATEFKHRNKRAEIYAVDTWKGSNEEAHTKLLAGMGGAEVLYSKFLNHIRQANVADMVKPIRMSSVEASMQFENESLDVVFIDASHEYKDVLDDINHWYPKIKKGGIISGHDYVPGHKVSEAGVIRAVNEIFLGQHLEIGQAGRTWLHIKR